jgi:Ca2+-binding RTX toxin-like protein
MFERYRGAGPTFLLLVGIVILSGQAQASATTYARCNFTADLAVHPGMSASPSKGNFGGGSGSLDCVGQVGHHTVWSGGKVQLEGTYGDGSVAETTGGDTCLAGGGVLEVSIEARNLVNGLSPEPAYSRARGSLRTAWAGAVLGGRGELVDEDGDPAAAVLDATVDFGRCGTEIARSASISGRLTLIHSGDGSPAQSGEPALGECANQVAGTDRSDRLHGTPESDLISGFGGRDRISGLAGTDCIYAGNGVDVVTGGADDDEIDVSRGGRDRVTCGAGRDTVFTDPTDVVSASCERVRR